MQDIWKENLKFHHIECMKVNYRVNDKSCCQDITKHIFVNKPLKKKEFFASLLLTCSLDKANVEDMTTFTDPLLPISSCSNRVQQWNRNLLVLTEYKEPEARFSKDPVT